jgi:O-antigen/teichoic acid export membrane protein
MSADLRSRVIHGLGWKAFSQITVQVFALVTTIFIAHLLTPSEVGLVAMATVFSALALVFADLALGAALVQRETLTEDDRSTAFWTTVVVGTALMLAGFLLAGPIARLYGEPEVKPLFQVISITFLFTTLGTTQGALLIRDLRFRSLEVRTVIASAIASCVAIALALAGFGPWAIVGQKLTVTGVSTVLLWRASGWRPHFAFSSRSLRELFGFSGFIVGSRFLAYLERNTDNYLVGRHVGSAALGAYSVAYNVMLVPLTRLASPVQQVFYPALSKIREAARVGETWLHATRMVAFITVPAFAGMAVVAPDFVAVVLGDQWEDSAPVLRILCWVGIVQSVAWQTVSVLQAMDRTSQLFRFAVVSSTVTVVAFAVGVQWGIVGVAAGYAIATTVLAPYYLSLPMRATGIGPRRFLGAIAGVLQASTVMAVVLVAVRLLVLDSLSPALRLTVLVAVGAAVYLPLAAWRVPEALAELRSLRRRRQDNAETLVS